MNQFMLIFENRIQVQKNLLLDPGFHLHKIMDSAANNKQRTEQISYKKEDVSTSK